MKARYTKRTVTSHSAPSFQDHINTLPTELLAEIFLLLHIASTESSSMKAFVKTTIRLVCRRWRTIIETTTAFWTEVRIVPPSGPREAHHLLQRLKTAVTRAGLQPLHIIWDHPPEVENDTFAGLISYLFQYAPTSRWIELTVHSDRLKNLERKDAVFSHARPEPSGAYEPKISISIRV
jgi:F-box-like